jgi:hypothetical protein
MSVGVHAVDLTLPAPAVDASDSGSSLCGRSTVPALLGLLLALHSLLYLRQLGSAPPPHASLHLLLQPQQAAPPGPLDFPGRSDCAVERQWEAAVQPGGALPWRNSGTYDSLLLAELAALDLPLTHGFYMETGAWMGEKLSHSWLYESHLCWTGLLVEPSAAFFDCQRNRPSSTVVHAALVDSQHNGSSLAAGIDSTPTNSAPMDDSGVLAIKPNADRVPAYSIETLLQWKGVGSRGVAWWTLDVEGLEMQVLGGLGHYRPRVVIIEVWDIDTPEAPQNKEAVLQFMAEAGYSAGRAISEKGVVPPVQDFLFIHNEEDS